MTNRDELQSKGHREYRNIFHHAFTADVSRMSLFQACHKAVALILLVLRIQGATFEEVVDHTLWSSSPLDEASITSNGIWEDVPNTIVKVGLTTPKSVLISYSVTVFPQVAILTSTGVPAFLQGTRAKGRDDLLAFRVVVDSFPARQSGSYTGYYYTESSLVTGYLAAELATGNHSVHLQWKKLGSYVQQWSINPRMDTGFAGGCTLVVVAQHLGFWCNQPLTPISVTKADSWGTAMTLNLSFTVTKSVRIIYHMPVRPDALATNVGNIIEELEAVVDINGSRYRDSSSSMVTTVKSNQLGLLVGALTISLLPGSYIISLVWRVNSVANRHWRSIPSYIDGFMMGRMLSVICEPASNIIQVFSDPISVSSMSASQWFDVGTPLQFFLPRYTNVLLSYYFPIQLLPSITSLNQDNFAMSARLLIDNQPYRSTGSSISNPIRGTQTAQGRLVLSLPPGTHAVRLQWKYLEELDANEVLTILKHINGNIKKIELTVQMDSWIDKPSLVAPGVVSGLESQSTLIRGVSVQDVNPANLVVTDYTVVMSFTAQTGKLSLPATPGITYLSSSIVKGQLSVMNTALAQLTYSPTSSWFGIDSVYLAVKDVKLYTLDPTFKDIINIQVNVAHIPLPPILNLPVIQSSPTEDRSVNIQGLNIQGDFASLSNGTLINQQVALTLSVSNGLLSLHATAKVIFLMGRSDSNSPVIQIFGDVTEVNNAISTIQYSPDNDFNSLQHVETLDVLVRDVKTQMVASTSVPIYVVDKNDPSNIQMISPEVALKGYTLRYSGNNQLFLRIQVHSPLVGSQTSSGQFLSLQGSVNTLQNALQVISYTRVGAYYGSELISVESSTISTFDVSELSYMRLQLSNAQVDPVVQLKAVIPNHGSWRGGTIVYLTGGGFSQSGLYCQFGYGALEPLVTLNQTYAKCVVPPVQTSYDTFVVITDGFSTWTNILRFSYEASWSITGVNLAKYQMHIVRLQGDNLPNAIDMICIFSNDTRVQAKFISSKQIDCILPQQFINTQVQVVFSPNGGADLSDRFTVIPEAGLMVTKFWPTSAPKSGQTPLVIQTLS
ncbi:hypothetical protein AeRB84_002250 [Aphanomyces euteiches]|nr:hypothetical protein AeRB84_002250 [Aphanomyces euteiches]